MTGGATSSMINRPAPDAVADMNFWQREAERRAAFNRKNPPSKMDNLKKEMGKKIGKIFHGKVINGQKK